MQERRCKKVFEAEHPKKQKLHDATQLKVEATINQPHDNPEKSNEVFQDEIPINKLKNADLKSSGWKQIEVTGSNSKVLARIDKIKFSNTSTGLMSK